MLQPPPQLEDVPVPHCSTPTPVRGGPCAGVLGGLPCHCTPVDPRQCLPRPTSHSRSRRRLILAAAQPGPSFPPGPGSAAPHGSPQPTLPPEATLTTCPNGGSRRLWWGQGGSPLGGTKCQGSRHCGAEGRTAHPAGPPGRTSPPGGRAGRRPHRPRRGPAPGHRQVPEPQCDNQMAPALGSHLLCNPSLSQVLALPHLRSRCVRAAPGSAGRQVQGAGASQGESAHPPAQGGAGEGEPGRGPIWCPRTALSLPRLAWQLPGSGHLGAPGLVKTGVLWGRKALDCPRLRR